MSTNKIYSKSFLIINHYAGAPKYGPAYRHYDISKELIKNKGAIVNVTSISSNGKRGTSIPYAVSKGALQTLTVSLAKSLSPNVRVNAVSPGFTETAMTNQRSEEHKKRMAKQTLLNRIAKPEEIAETIFFLCVSGSYITGETINVNGGHGFNY